MSRHAEIVEEMVRLEDRLSMLRQELAIIQERCLHPKRPERKLGEEYMDTCPDCGKAFYCYRF